MTNPSRTNQELIEENALLREKIRHLEESEAERKRVEEALQASEEKHRLIAENTADLISIMDMNLRLTYISPASMRLRGYTAEEAMEQTLDQVLTPESIQRSLAVFEQEMQLEASGTADPDRMRTLELEEYGKNGSIIWVEVNLSFLRDKDGKPVQILIVSRDITERKRVEEALQESEEKYRILLQESPDPTFSFTPKGQYRYVNRAFADGVGKPVEDIIGKTIWDVFPKEEADMRFTSLSQVFRTGEEKIIEVRVPRPDGDRTYITTITPIKDAKGETFSAVCTSKDITDRKRMEEMLRESEEKFRTIFENSSSAMAIIERDTTISMVNREYCKMGLFEEKDVVGKSWTTQIPSGDIERLKEYSQKRLIDPTSAPEHYEFTFYRRDGKIRHSLMSVAVLPTSRNIICSFVDITERKQAEKALEEERRQLQLALDEVKTLRGILPICSNCKKIRDDKGFWNQVDQYISDHTEAEFSHGLCPNCAKELYPELYKKEL